MPRPPGQTDSDTRGLALAGSAVASLLLPVVVGVWLDERYGWSPWGLIGGSVLGFIALVRVSQSSRADQNETRGGEPPHSDK